ncbi:DNA-binding protein RFX7 [Eurytemora carolleeae]|uniref:DNA-binding protein RFX7 n=1 Tax=Eurytemora carolleeae TaxID=1294199 RepID=UPI000C771DCC|nr:DNA-binding protein RFX7 [Eurytemora carolleeae]|eukprot:XP_023346916.1 DNA-binding protein RFX7-like [Eurytemora affinis]
MADSRSILGDLDPSNSSYMELKMEPETEQGGGRREKLSQTVSDNISPESSKLIDNILEQVESLNPIERLLLYLKLPSRAQGPEIDPLRQPLNPLGSRSEITITINWIRTHLEEDPQVSLPKHEVYDEYLGYCGCNSIKPLSTADFGKVMKQVYPQVRPRRLGTRGNSRYCYAGLRKRIKLDVPGTPDISSEGRSGEGRDVDEEISSAASFLIREWVEKLLKVKVENMTELALHLLDKMYVDNRSTAACTLLSSVLRPVGQQQPQIQQLQQQTLQPQQHQQQQQLQQQDSKLILTTLNPQNNLRFLLKHRKE